MSNTTNLETVPAPQARQSKDNGISRAECVRRFKDDAPEIDPWGDVTFKRDGCRVKILARGKRRRIDGGGRVIGLPGAGFVVAAKVAREIERELGQPVLWEAIGTRVTGGVKDGKLTRWNFVELKATA